MSMRIAILTSHETRHRYFVNALCDGFEVVAVGYERTGYSPASLVGFDLSREEAKVVAGHFAERTRQEELFFGHHAEMLETDGARTIRHIAPGELNSAETVAFLTAARADALVVYGTNLIREPMLAKYHGRIINMHLGLSPYYRGTATNFYPLLNEEPQYVGATIHLIDKGIDTGPIIRHARPAIVAEDMPHTIGCKAIVAGVEAMIATLQELESGRLRAVAQWRPERARLYLRKDYHPRQVVELYEKLSRGMIAEFVARSAQAADGIRLVEPAREASVVRVAAP